YLNETVADHAAAGDHQAVALLPGGPPGGAGGGAAGFVVLDTAVTPDLAAEGLARDVIRAVQQTRRDAGPAITGRIELTLGGDDRLRSAVTTHRELIMTETLAEELTLVEAAEPGPLISLRAAGAAGHAG